ncbi:MAG: hypothetical protein ACF8SC_03790 [Phycisphaerales bacterium JB037]
MHRSARSALTLWVAPWILAGTIAPAAIAQSSAPEPVPTGVPALDDLGSTPRVEPSVDVKAVQLREKAQLEAVDAHLRFVLRGRGEELEQYEAWAAERPCPTCLRYFELTPETGIAQTLNGILDAVGGADHAAYLNLVSPADPVFFTEEWNWFRDVMDRPLESFSFQWSSDEIELNEAGLVATVPLTVLWNMPGGANREVSFPAAFHRTSSGAWKYAGRAWRVAEGAHAKVLFAEEHQREDAEAIIAALPAIMAHVHEGLETPMPEDYLQEVKIYTAMPELQYSIYPSYVDPLGGWNEPGEAIKLLDHGGDSFDVVVAHEYGHVVTFMMGPRITEAPWWVLEGTAELAAERFQGTRQARMLDRMVRRWAENGQLADWEDISDFRSTPNRLMAHVYVQGKHMMGYISERFGRSARNAWLVAIANGSSPDEASRSALGVGFAELDAAWRESLAPEEQPVDEPVGASPN